MLSEQLVCVQDVAMADDMGVEETSALQQHQQHDQVAEGVAEERQVQPWQARLAGHAEAILQLDKDSLCRLSDPCQHPSKRSRSCPPDSFGAAPQQPADSTDAVHAAHGSKGAPSNSDEEAMSGQALDAASAGQTGQAVQSDIELHQRPPPDAVTLPQGAALCHLATRTVSSIPPAVAMLAAQQPDSLDMTQPNLTPASQRYRLAAQGSTDPRTAPVRPFPSASLLRPAADLDPDQECNKLGGAGPSSSRPHHSLNPANEQTAQDQRGQSRQQQHWQQQQQQQPAIGQRGSGPLGVGKGKAAKWKQRAGVRDNGFGENEHAMSPPDGIGARQGEELCLQMHCFLQVFHTTHLPAQKMLSHVLGFLALLLVPSLL